MIKVEFNIGLTDYKLMLKVTGHAGQAPEGQDLVCASVSILTYTLAKNIEDCNESGMLVKEPVIRLDKGDAELTCNADKEAFSYLLGKYTTIWEGYQLLAQEYPQYVETLI